MVPFSNHCHWFGHTPSQKYQPSFFAGAAFGDEEAGGRPNQDGDPPQKENAVAKALRQAGFPSVETVEHPSEHGPKVTTALQKRIMKLDVQIEQCQQASQVGFITKILALAYIRFLDGFYFRFPSS